MEQKWKIIDGPENADQDCHFQELVFLGQNHGFLFGDKRIIWREDDKVKYTREALILNTRNGSHWETNTFGRGRFVFAENTKNGFFCIKISDNQNATIFEYDSTKGNWGQKIIYPNFVRSVYRLNQGDFIISAKDEKGVFQILRTSDSGQNWYKIEVSDHQGDQLIFDDDSAWLISSIDNQNSLTRIDLKDNSVLNIDLPFSLKQIKLSARLGKIYLIGEDDKPKLFEITSSLELKLIYEFRELKDYYPSSFKVAKNEILILFSKIMNSSTSSIALRSSNKGTTWIIEDLPNPNYSKPFDHRETPTGNICSWVYISRRGFQHSL